MPSIPSRKTRVVKQTARAYWDAEVPPEAHFDSENKLSGPEKQRNHFFYGYVPAYLYRHCKLQGGGASVTIKLIVTF
jgi:hypothetical protein